MEQRRLRLGDILDDYCPRERRVTNHAVVAMIDEDVKQTRCTTCDAEHPYKGGSAPRRRKKTSESVPALAAPAVEAPPPLRATAPVVASHTEEEVDQPGHEDEQDDLPFLGDEGDVDAPVLSADADDLHEDEPHDDDLMPETGPVEEGPVHRRLIRATLPRVEGQKDARQPTEFTIRQSNGRGGNTYRGDNRQQMRGNGQPANGNRPHGSARFAGSRPANGGGRGGPRGQNSGFRSAQPQQRRGGGGRKRSR